MVESFEINRGSDVAVGISLTDSIGEPLNLSGYVVALEDSTVTGMTVAVLNAPDGILTLSVPRAQCLILPSITYFRVKLTAPDATVSTTERIYVNVV